MAQRISVIIGWLIALLLPLGQAFAAATLLPNGQQCFQATAPTSGGLSGPITAPLGTISAGASYVNGTYTNVPLTGGSGFGATATITVTGNIVVNVSLTNPGSHYAAGDVLSASNTNLGGAGSGFSVPVLTVSTTGTGLIGLLGVITGGTGGTAGTYSNVALTGGSGSGATANITVASGAVTAVTILNPGIAYVVADTLSAASGSIGGTTGFSVPISSIQVNQSLAGGQVFMYVPNTTTFKQTWQNAAQTVLNTNPVTLDQNGCATIYGTGSYRQVLQDALGNTVWDKLTTDTSAQQNTFWAGIAGGTPNAITVVDPGFNATDGSIVNFTALNTNTGATTLNPSSFGAINIQKDTSGGPVALTGGEIVATNPISAVYRAQDNAFHLLNAVIPSASGATTPFCGAIGLQITNGSTPNSVISIVADQVVMQTNAGLIINRTSVTLNAINILLGNSTSAPNGMDGEAPGTNNWLHVWMIDNGAAPAGLVSSASGNGIAPVLPSGYNYKCRLGTFRVDGSGNLLRLVQHGSETQYSLPPVITSTPGAYYTLTSITTFAPPLAQRFSVAAEMSIASTATPFSGSIAVAPNGAYGQPNASGRPPCSLFVPTTSSTINFGSSQICTFVLEGFSIFTGAASSNATVGGTFSAFGWKDRVNAN